MKTNNLSELFDKSCFAYKEGADTCIALLDSRGCGKNCPFYKSREKAAADIEKTYEHIRSLPKEAQLSISGTYYHGKMPWLKGGKRR
jgi:hypothetical protein